MAENNTSIQIRIDFNQIFGIINYHRQRVSKTSDDESLRMIWEVQYKEQLKVGGVIQRSIEEYCKYINAEL